MRKLVVILACFVVALPWIIASGCGEKGVRTGTGGGGGTGVIFQAKKDTYTGTKGGKCRVVDGANKGKRGTYNSDGDCSGGWGITECTDGGKSNGKCQDVAKISVTPVAGENVLVLEGVLELEDGSLVEYETSIPASEVEAELKRAMK